MGETPGWYPDPRDSTRDRYWDGSSWTIYLWDRLAAPEGSPALAAAAAYAQAEQPAVASAASTWHESLEPVGPPKATTLDPVGPPKASSLTPQRLLLGLGASMLIAAAGAFAVYAWTIIPAAGRAALLVLIAAVFLGVAAKIRIRALGETFSIVGFGILAALAAYGPAAGMLPSNIYMPAGGWIGTLVLAGLAALGYFFAKLTKLLAPLIISASATAAGGLLGALWVGHLAREQAGGAAAFTALASGACLILLVPSVVRGWSPRAFIALTYASAGMLIMLLEVQEITASYNEDGKWQPWWAGAFLVAAAMTAFLAKAVGPDEKPLRSLYSLAAATGLGAGIGAALSAAPAPLSAPVVVTTLAAVAVLIGIQFQKNKLPVPTWALAGAAGGAVLLAWSAPSSNPYLDSGNTGAWAATFGTLSILTLLYGLFGKIAHVVWVFPAAGTLTILLTLSTGNNFNSELAAYLIATLVLVTLAVAVWRKILSRGHALNAGIVTVLLAGLPSFLLATASSPGLVTLLLTFITIALAFAAAWLRPTLKWVSIPAAFMLAVMLLTKVSDFLPGEITFDYITFCLLVAYIAGSVPLVRTKRLILRHASWGALAFASLSIIPASIWAAGSDMSADGLSPNTSLSLALTGAAITAWAVTAWRKKAPALLGVSGGLAWVLTVCIMSGKLDISDPRLYFVATGAIAGAALIGARILRPSIPSIAWLGAPLALILIPYSISPGMQPSENAALFAVVVIALVVCAAAGAWLKVAGLLAPAAIGLILVILALLLNAAQAVPVWIPLTVGGALLLLVGVRLEAARGAVRKGTTWAKTLR